MGNATNTQQRVFPLAAQWGAIWSPTVLTSGMPIASTFCNNVTREVSMVTPFSPPGSSATPSSSTSASDYTSLSSDDAFGSTRQPGEGSISSSAPVGEKPDLMERVVRGAHDTVDRLADKAKPQLQRLQDSAGSASDSLHNRVDQARELGDEWTDSLRSAVRENPLAAVGTALALGLIIARLSR